MTGLSPPDGRAGVDAELVARLVATQFPQWRDLPVRPVAVDGWDNRTYRLGTELTVRLPTAAGYAPAIEKEHRWLPYLRPWLPVPVPEEVAVGEPTADYPFPWSVRRWLGGDTATLARIRDLTEFADQVGTFLRALQNVPADDGPAAGAHSFYRGAPLGHYDGETRSALDVLAGRIDTRRAAAVWSTALSTSWDSPPRWFHGDIAVGNLLVTDGRLSGVIDFGTCGVGDPACDLVLAWTLFAGPSRSAFRAAIPLDPATWARARGWALWKSLIGLAATLDTDPARSQPDLRIVGEVLADG